MTFVVALSMPKGARPMTDAEIARLKWGQMVDVLDTHSGVVAKGSVISENAGGALVKFRGGHTTLLGAGSTDEQFVAITTQLAEALDDPNNAMAVALRASNEIAKLKGRIRVLEETVKRQADVIQAAPNREDFDAMMADVAQLQADYRVLRLVRAS